MSEIFSKTAKGQEEIKTRTGGLTQRMRQVLIFVDGKRSREELHGMLKGDDMDELLAALVEEGYIEILGKAAAPAAIPKAAVPQPAKPQSPAPQPAAAKPAAAQPTPPKPSAPAQQAAPKAPAAPPPKPSAEELERLKQEAEKRRELELARSFLGKLS